MLILAKRRNFDHSVHNLATSIPNNELIRERRKEKLCSLPHLAMTGGNGHDSAIHGT